MAAKDLDRGGDPAALVGEVADLWFHSMIALAHYGLSPADVIAELERREGTSGIEEKALRKARGREAGRMSETDFATFDAKTSGDRTVMHVLYGLHTVALGSLGTLASSR
jgi:hypothetical protein